jgi:tetratricopeptide (TPR) repeat protein
MRLRLVALVGVLALCLVPTSRAAAAQGNDEGVHEAGKHFQRGVTLYGEADYRGALIEFKRAYDLAPNGAVLYNIGETEFQLRDYAGALTTFERFLVEAGPTDSHRAEVETNVRELKSRVGQVTITTVPSGAEVSIDDRALGKTPLDGPVVVGIGHVKVSATMPGRQAVTRYVDVAAEDDVSVVLQLPVGQAAKQAASAAGGTTSAGEAPVSAGGSSTLRVLGWVGTGLLGAGALAFGAVALKASSDLKTERNAYKDNPSVQYGDSKRAQLDHLASRTRTYSIVADSFAVAAVVLGAVTLVSGLGSSSGESSATQVSVGLNSMTLSVTF